MRAHRLWDFGPIPVDKCQKFQSCSCFSVIADSLDIVVPSASVVWMFPHSGSHVPRTAHIKSIEDPSLFRLSTRCIYRRCLNILIEKSVAVSLHDDRLSGLFPELPVNHFWMIDMELNKTWFAFHLTPDCDNNVYIWLYRIYICTFRVADIGGGVAIHNGPMARSAWFSLSARITNLSPLNSPLRNRSKASFKQLRR